MKPRVLLVGWDAADWRVISPLVDGGHMPRLGGLIERGVCGRLATIQPPLSPMLWTSIATGKRAWKHGIHGFTEVDPHSGALRPVSTLSRSCKALWNILHQQGLTSHVCGWWPSHPAEPVRGSMVSNHFQQAVAPLGQPWPVRPGAVHPRESAEALAALRVHPHSVPGDVLRHFVPRAPELDQEKDRRLDTVARIFAECSTVQAAATHLMLHEPDWDLAAVYFDAIDHFSHAFMRYHPPRLEWVSEEDFALYEGVIRAAYVYHDLMLGVLLELAGPEATVMVISDHGFHPDHLRPRVLPNEPAGPAAEHGPYGILVAAGPGFKRDATIQGATLLDVTPTALVRFGLPVGRDMDGSVLAGLWETPPEVSYVDSWEDLPGEAGRHTTDAYAPDQQEALAALRQLEDLGYIDAAPADARQAAEEAVREQRYNLARAFLDGGEAHRAREILRELWDRWPEESRFGVQLLQSLLESEMPVEARMAFELLRERKAAAAQGATDAYQKRIKELAAGQTPPIGPTDGAEGEPTLPAEVIEKLDEGEKRGLRKLRARARTNPLAFAYLEGSLLALEGHPREALEHLARAAKAQQANRASALVKMAQVHASLGEWEASATHCRQAIKLAPDDPTLRFHHARALLAQRAWAAAAEEARIALALRHFFPQAALVAGIGLWRAGDPAGAELFLRRAIEQNPVYPSGQYWMAAFCRRQLGDSAAAAKHRRLGREANRRVALHAAGQGLPGVHRDEYRSGFGTGLVFAKPAAPPATPLSSSLLIVSGLPRSGTSMMMQMLAAGGFPVLADEQRAADESNPRGYFELERVKALHKDAAWLDEARGKAVKIVCPLLTHLPPPCAGRGYRLVLMRRPLEEVAQSQLRMLERLGKPGGPTLEALLRILRQQLVQTLTTLNHWNATGMLAVLDLSYHFALQEPLEAARQIEWFLGPEARFQVADAAVAVARELHREKTSGG